MQRLVINADGTCELYTRESDAKPWQLLRTFRDSYNRPRHTGGGFGVPHGRRQHSGAQFRDHFTGSR